MKAVLLTTSALMPLACIARQARSGWLRRGLQTGALVLLAATVPIAGSLPIAPDDVGVAAGHDGAAIFGDDGDDEFGENGDYDDLIGNEDRADRGDIGERGEYREGEFGERDDTGWNRPPADNANESGELLQGLGTGGDGNAPAPNSGGPLIDGLGQGSSGGGLLE